MEPVKMRKVQFQCEKFDGKGRFSELMQLTFMKFPDKDSTTLYIEKAKGDGYMTRLNIHADDLRDVLRELLEDTE